jgi:hypothetical protein
MIAGAFAFVPVEQASTVHTSSGNSAIQEAVTTLTTATDQDILVTCPATSSGCHILEVYVNSTVATVVFATIDAVINGVAITTLIDNADLTVGAAATALLPEVGGLSIGPGDTLEFITTDGGTGDTARYTLRIIAEVGNGVAMTGVGQA